ncbi:MAG: hypothetical protein AAGD04_12120 [Pseudomonadota bacterium]
MQPEKLVGTTLVAYFLFLCLLAVIIAVLFMWKNATDKKQRRLFFSQFDLNELRMSAHQVGVVYKVLSEDDETVEAVRIWDKSSKVLNAKSRHFKKSYLIPFQEDRFL